MSDRGRLYFEKLGSTIHDAWRCEGFNGDAFANIAERVLIEAPPSEHVSFSDCVRFSFLDNPLPFQIDLKAPFGQPPLTVYWQHEFRIDLLFWVDSLLEIHEHAFSGAFHIVHGSSIHSEWTFELGARFGHHLVLGQLIPEKVELLRRGDTRIIRPGKRFIHSTYHLDRPSISLVVRTNRESGALPFFVYLRPGIAYAPEEISVPMRRRSQVLRMLSRSQQSDELVEITSNFLNRCEDPLEVFYTLLETMGLVRTSQQREILQTAAAMRHSTLVSEIRPALDARFLDSALAAVRERVDTTDLRFFLATLSHSRDVIFELIDAQYPGSNTVDRIGEWLLALSRCGILHLPSSELHAQILPGLLALKSTRNIHHKLVTAHPSLDKQVIDDMRHILLSHRLLANLFAPSTGQTQ